MFYSFVLLVGLASLTGIIESFLPNPYGALADASEGNFIIFGFSAMFFLILASPERKVMVAAYFAWLFAIPDALTDFYVLTGMVFYPDNEYPLSMISFVFLGLSIYWFRIKK